MAIKKFRPITPANRYKEWPAFDDITKSTPEKSLLEPLPKSGGRNNTGRITSRHIGGGHKRKYRLIDFKRGRHDVPAKVIGIEYDPNRTARIALIEYADGQKSYILAPNKLEVGSTVQSGEKAPATVGNSLPLSKIPLGTSIHNVEIVAGKGGQLARSAGQEAILSNRESGFALVRLPSGEIRNVDVRSRATIGEVSNEEHSLRQYGKAGAIRWKGIRPTVRGTAMNPVDHPHGGGEGKTGEGMPQVSPWNTLTKGYRTRSNKRTQTMIVSRRKK